MERLAGQSLQAARIPRQTAWKWHDGFQVGIALLQPLHPEQRSHRHTARRCNLAVKFFSGAAPGAAVCQRNAACERGAGSELSHFGGAVNCQLLAGVVCKKLLGQVRKAAENGWQVGSLWLELFACSLPGVLRGCG